MSIADKLTTVAENQEKVFDAGRTKEWSDFWDNWQNKGNRTDYNCAFYRDSSSSRVNFGDFFYPKYNMKPSYSAEMFYNFSSSDGGGTINLEERLEECNVILDFSNTSYSGKTFYYADAFNTLPVIDLSKAVETHYFFFWAAYIVTIRKLIVKQKAGTSMFYGMARLENIVIEGELFGDLNFSVSRNLTHDSLMSIINALKDYSGTTTTYKLTLGSTNIAKLTADELNMIEAKGWTYA